METIKYDGSDEHKKFWKNVKYIKFNEKVPYGNSQLNCSFETHIND